MGEAVHRKHANAYGIDLAMDASGNAFVVGEFINTAIFGTTTLATAGDQSMFVTKYDASGTVVWANKYGTDHIGNDEYVTGIAVDASGNIYVSGYYFGSSNNHRIHHAHNSGSTGSSDGFIFKLNSSALFNGLTPSGAMIIQAITIMRTMLS